MSVHVSTLFTFSSCSRCARNCRPIFMCIDVISCNPSVTYIFQMSLARSLLPCADACPRLPPFSQRRNTKRLLSEISMILSGKPHKPPGSVAPWLLQGGKEGAIARSKGKGGSVLVGVGGENVPTARTSIDRGSSKETVKRGGFLSNVSLGSQYLRILSCPFFLPTRVEG